MRTVTVVGASLAGLSAASALRSGGFDGRVVVIGDEQRAPYDRPPLSKDFLAGSSQLADLTLAAPDSDDLDVEWRLGTTARELDTDGAAVVLTSGERLQSDGVVVATGARARTMAGAALPGVHTLRTVDDALALRADLRPGARLVVIGGGLIGAEVASTARGLGLDVTVVEACPLPLADRFPRPVAEVCVALQREHGTRVLCGATVAEFLGYERVRGVRLSDGREVAADVVVVGIGSTPNVEWLEATGLTSRAGVVTSDAGATGNPSVVAAGDCVATYDPATGRAVRHEHWSNAQQQPRAAVATLLGRPYRTPASARSPYFWSDQYGRRLQFAGRLAGGEDVEIVEGDPEARDFVAVFRPSSHDPRRSARPSSHDPRRSARPGAAVAVFAMGCPRTFGSWRRSLAHP